MKRSEIFFSLILIPIDALMILLGFIIAYYWRKYHGDIIAFWEFNDYIKFVLYLLPAWIIVFGLEGLYNIKKSRQGVDEFFGIILAVSMGIMLVVAWLFISRTFFFSRLVILYTWILTIIFVVGARNIIRFIQRYLYRYQIGVRNVILVGNNEISYNICKYLQNNRGVGYKIEGIIKTSNTNINSKNNSLKILGSLKDINKILKEVKIDEIIFTESKISDETILKIMQLCEEKLITFCHAPNLYEVKTSNIDVSTLAGIPIIEFKRTPLDGWGRIIKRIIDIIGAIVGIIIFGPIMIIISILIKLDSPGPVIYKNERVREGCKKFFTYKFRSMKMEYCTGLDYGGSKATKYEKRLIQEKNERVGPIYKILQDPRRTKIGRMIERTSLDELPQFFNVLLGNMSLVGPRPHQPCEVEKYLLWHKKVLRIKPGISGMAQISGRSDLNFDDEAKLDIYYIENWSLWLDIKIIVLTPLAVIKPRKAV